MALGAVMLLECTCEQQKGSENGHQPIPGPKSNIPVLCQTPLTGSANPIMCFAGPGEAPVKMMARKPGEGTPAGRAGPTGFGVT